MTDSLLKAVRAAFCSTLVFPAGSILLTGQHQMGQRPGLGYNCKTGRKMNLKSCDAADFKIVMQFGNGHLLKGLLQQQVQGDGAISAVTELMLDDYAHIIE